MNKKSVFLALLLMLFSFSIKLYAYEVVTHTNGGINGHDQIYVDPPYVTYDDDLNQLYVYFGSTGTIDIEYLDPTGTPYYLVYGESHAGYTSATYNSLPAGYYTITIHSIYGYTYTGNFYVY